jgi:hypothetical protein
MKHPPSLGYLGGFFMLLALGDHNKYPTIKKNVGKN